MNPHDAAGGAPRFAPVDLDTIRPNRGWFVGLGAALVVLGVLAIFLPFAASLATTLVIGWLMLFGGLFQAYHAARNRGFPAAH